MNAASQIPSAVLISTSSSTSFDCAADIEPVAAASPAAADRATNSRRERSSSNASVRPRSLSSIVIYESSVLKAPIHAVVQRRRAEKKTYALKGASQHLAVNFNQEDSQRYCHVRVGLESAGPRHRSTSKDEHEFAACGDTVRQRSGARARRAVAWARRALWPLVCKSHPGADRSQGPVGNFGSDARPARLGETRLLHRRDCRRRRFLV